jgi:hypothetical protein
VQKTKVAAGTVGHAVAGAAGDLRHKVLGDKELGDKDAGKG